MMEVVRQQWNFSPAGSTTEAEHYFIDLDSVSVLELALRPGPRKAGDLRRGGHLFLLLLRQLVLPRAQEAEAEAGAGLKASAPNDAPRQ